MKKCTLERDFTSVISVESLLTFYQTVIDTKEYTLKINHTSAINVASVSTRQTFLSGMKEHI